MENIKETYQNIRDNVSRLCSTRQSTSQKDIAIGQYVLEKSARIVSATLLVTNVMDTDSAMRESIERTSLRLVEEASTAGFSSSERNTLLKDIHVLATLLMTAGLSGRVAKNNSDILVAELVALAQFVGEQPWSEERRFFDPALLFSEIPNAVYETETRTPSETPKRHPSISTGTVGVPRATFTQTDVEQFEKDKHNTAGTHYKDRVQEIQKDRRATILGLLQRKDRLTVKDVAYVIKDCSEKTIQRELLALVGQGVLKKEGERRWSTYTLA